MPLSDAFQSNFFLPVSLTIVPTLTIPSSIVGRSIFFALNCFVVFGSLVVSSSLLESSCRNFMRYCSPESSLFILLIRPAKLDFLLCCEITLSRISFFGSIGYNRAFYASLACWMPRYFMNYLSCSLYICLASSDLVKPRSATFTL